MSYNINSNQISLIDDRKDSFYKTKSLESQVLKNKKLHEYFFRLAATSLYYLSNDKYVGPDFTEYTKNALRKDIPFIRWLTKTENETSYKESLSIIYYYEKIKNHQFDDILQKIAVENTYDEYIDAIANDQIKPSEAIIQSICIYSSITIASMLLRGIDSLDNEELKLFKVSGVCLVTQYGKSTIIPKSVYIDPDVVNNTLKNIWCSNERLDKYYQNKNIERNEARFFDEENINENYWLVDSYVEGDTRKSFVYYMLSKKNFYGSIEINNLINYYIYGAEMYLNKLAAKESEIALIEREKSQKTKEANFNRLECRILELEESLKAEKNKTSDQDKIIRRLIHNINDLNNNFEELIQFDEDENLANKTENMSEVAIEKEILNIAEAKRNIQDLNITVIGGHENLVNKLQNEFSAWSFIDAGKAAKKSQLVNKELLVMLTDHMSHITFYSAMNVIKEYALPICYVHSTNIDSIILAINKHVMGKKSE